MTETYERMRARQQAEFNAFPIKAAFGNDRFETMMKEWGFDVSDTDKIISIGYGSFIRKCDLAQFREMVSRQNREMECAMKDADFFKSAALYEMCNHEYAINMQGDYDVINALGFSVDFYDGEELERCSDMTDEQKRMYLEARREYYRLAEENGWF